MRDRRRPLREHLEELRRRLIVSAIVLVVGLGVSFAFFQEFLRFLLAPAQAYLSPTGKPIFTEVTEYLGVAVRVSLLGGFALATPVILHQAVMFVAPALTPQERRYAFSIIPGALLLFAGGVAFAYFILLPPALRFLLTWGQDVATPMVRIGPYINLVVTLLFWMGLVFETPLIMFLLARFGVVSPEAFGAGRRYAIVGAFLLAAIITPTFDPVNQTLVAVPLILLYELGIWLSKLAVLQPRPVPRRRAPRPEAPGTPGH